MWPSELERGSAPDDALQELLSHLQAVRLSAKSVNLNNPADAWGGVVWQLAGRWRLAGRAASFDGSEHLRGVVGADWCVARWRESVLRHRRD